MALADIHTSFGAGELSKNLYARVDIDKYHVGAALLRNFFTDFRGGASTRAGYQFIAQTKSAGNPVIVPFQVSTAQTYIVELGELYARFYTGGAPVVDTVASITGITQASPGVVTVSGIGNIANGRTVVVAGIVGMTQLNGRTFKVAGVSGSTFTLQQLNGTPINTTNYGAYVSGGTVSLVYELATPWHESDFYNSDGTLALKYAQSADTMTLVHSKYPPQLLKRLTSSTFSIQPMVIAPVQKPPTNLTATPISGGAATAGYVVTAVDQSGREESLQSNAAFTSQNFSNLGSRLTWTAPLGVPPSRYKIYKWGNNNDPHMDSVFGYIGSSLTTSFYDDNLSPDFTKGPPQFVDPFTPSQPLNVKITAPGGFGALNPPAVNFSGSSLGYAILTSGGALAGVIISFPGTDPTHVETVSFTPGGGATATVGSWTADSGTYPTCVSYFQQRQCFASSANQPQNIWMSQVGNSFNFDQALIPLDSDAITIALASRQVNQIKSMVPMPSGLVLLTSGGAWLMSGGGTLTAITPSNTVAQPQASSGANDIPPLVINNDIIYVQSRGSVVRSLVFNFYVQSYFGTDRSLLANHLFYGFGLTSGAFAEEPFRLAYFTRNDGTLLSMTYVPEQEIYAWSHHDTNGLFQWVTSVVEGQEDAVYVLTKRFINNQWLNYIERLTSRNWQGQVEFCTCLDASLQLGQVKPSGTLLLSAVSGPGVTVTSSTPAFAGTVADVGKVIRGAFGGKAVITAAISTIQATVNVLYAFPTVQDTTTPAPINSGQWMIGTPVSTLQGLDHLAGQTITALADGEVLTGLVVTQDGTVKLPKSYSYITAGLPYQPQLQTLYLDLGEPTVQSKRKLIPQVEVRLDDTRGLKFGSTRNQFTGALAEMKDPSLSFPATPPEQLFTGDIMITTGSDWTTTGQLCAQQDYPLPATILGLIAQVVVGDTQK